jgi:hypothetical protein
MTKDQLNTILTEKINFYEGFLKNFEDLMENLVINFPEDTVQKVQTDYFKLLNDWRKNEGA